MAKAKREYKHIPRIVLDLRDEQKKAFDALCEAIFPGANASYSHVLRTLIKEACKQKNIKFPE